MYNDGEGVLESRLKWRGSTVVTKEDKNVPVHQSCIQFHLVVQQGPGEMLALLVLSLEKYTVWIDTVINEHSKCTTSLP